MLHPNPKLSIFVLPSVALIAIFVLTVSWVGFYGGDDFKYYRAAKDWLEAVSPRYNTGRSDAIRNNAPVGDSRCPGWVTPNSLPFYQPACIMLRSYYSLRMRYDG